MDEVKKYALFDLDQTLVPWDTQLLFRNYVLRQKGEGWRRLLTFVFLAYVPLFRLLGAGQMKRIFHCYLWRISREKLDGLAEGFVREWLPKVVYKEMKEVLRERREAGEILVLSSASPELWVEKIGRELGFDHALGTHLQWGEEVPFFPALLGLNHKGKEKVRRLESLGIISGEAGYSDSKADLPMLEMCEQRVLINPLPEFERYGEEQGWQILYPEKPWATRFQFGWGSFLQLWGFYRG